MSYLQKHFRMSISLLLCLGLSCAGYQPDRPRYVTECGLQFEGEVDTRMSVKDWNQEDLQSAEDQIVSTFTQKVTDARFKDACSRLNGFRVFVYPASSWTDYWGRSISGETYCFDKGIVVNNDSPLRGSLPHELAHAVQSCGPLYPIDEGLDKDHANWYRDGIYQALNEIP